MDKKLEPEISAIDFSQVHYRTILGVFVFVLCLITCGFLIMDYQKEAVEHLAFAVLFMVVYAYTYWVWFLGLEVFKNDRKLGFLRLSCGIPFKYFFMATTFSYVPGAVLIFVSTLMNSLASGGDEYVHISSLSHLLSVDESQRYFELFDVIRLEFLLGLIAVGNSFEKVLGMSKIKSAFTAALPYGTMLGYLVFIG